MLSSDNAVAQSNIMIALDDLALSVDSKNESQGHNAIFSIVGNLRNLGLIPNSLEVVERVLFHLRNSAWEGSELSLKILDSLALPGEMGKQDMWEFDWYNEVDERELMWSLIDKSVGVSESDATEFLEVMFTDMWDV